jgi:hypothetical protein
VKPIDFSRETWESIQPEWPTRLAKVLEAWRTHGPGTTAELAAKSGMSILSLRPRTTELLQAGLLVLAGFRKHEGIYRAVGDYEWALYKLEKMAE